MLYRVVTGDDQMFSELRNRFNRERRMCRAYYYQAKVEDLKKSNDDMYDPRNCWTILSNCLMNLKNFFHEPENFFSKKKKQQNFSGS